MSEPRRFSFWAAPIEAHTWPPAVFELFGCFGRVERRMTAEHFASWKNVLRACGFELRAVEHRPVGTELPPGNDAEYLHRTLNKLLNATAPLAFWLERPPAVEELELLMAARWEATKAVQAVKVGV